MKVLLSAALTAGMLITTAGMASADTGRKAPDYRRAGTIRKANDLTVVVYANCTQMHKGYPNGIGRSADVVDLANGHRKRYPDTKFFVFRASYNVNARLDRDKDGIACEA